jgi:hypothetical protein
MVQEAVEDAIALEAAGITALEHRLRELAEPRGRQAELHEQLLQLAVDLAEWLESFRDPNGRPLATWWRPDSWVRWEAKLPDDDPFAAEIQRRLQRS